jgi:hypothetical protein
MISFKEFLNLVDKTYNEHSFIWRYGQTIMNVLHGVWPEKYSEIAREQTNDCYYDDGIVRFTLNQLEKEWPNGC